LENKHLRKKEKETRFIFSFRYSFWKHDIYLNKQNNLTIGPMFSFSKSKT